LPPVTPGLPAQVVDGRIEPRRRVAVCIVKPACGMSPGEEGLMNRKLPLVALAGAQFIMVLDQSVMNVSISQLVADFHTTVTTIQTVITLYCLVMAMLMLTGGKIGDIIGRRRAFVIGLVIYACGSLMTALAPTVAILTLGWSILEGIGAALVLPAMAALIAGNFEGKDRKVAYAVIGGVAGAGIAVGPIVGGWATTELSWRVVFAGEVVLVAGILVMTRFVGDALRSGPKPRLDVVGAVLSAAGLGAIVLGVLQTSTWGLVEPKDAPIEPFGLSPTLFVIAGGAALLWAFVQWQRHREATGSDPLVHLDLLKIPTLRSGLIGLFTQNLVLMGIFFVVPLYLQLVLGLDALETGLKMLPTSITMFVTAAAGSRLSSRYPVRTITRAGLSITALACLALLATIKPDLGDLGFAVSMAILGIGMGLIASQLGLVVQSSVDASGRGEAGGLQYTGQQLGSSLGVALIGAIVLAGLTSSFITKIEADPRIAAEVSAQVGVAVDSGLDFVSSSQIEAAAQQAGLDAATTAAIVDDYEQAQLRSLKAGLLAAALIALIALAFTKDLPHAGLARAGKPAGSASTAPA
jgi:MFS family permease